MAKLQDQKNSSIGLSLQDSDILAYLSEEAFVNQRLLSEATGHSLGVVNRSLKNLTEFGYIDDSAKLTSKADKLFKTTAPKNAIILAAGFGMRMVPINLSAPKAFLEVNGERLIERQIRQLHEAGIKDITVVVGFMKDSFEYLIDEFGVELVYNPDYSTKNNIFSLALVSDRLSNTYIVPCDVWCDKNPFKKNELYSWYMVSDLIDEESTVRLNRKTELVMVPEFEAGNRMVGISYLLENDSAKVADRLKTFVEDSMYENSFWEVALYDKDRMFIPAKVVPGNEAVEINTYEQLREFDSKSNLLQNDAINVIAEALSCEVSEIEDINILKKGMTNRSFVFSVKGQKYIMRIPGEGTDLLINRKEEAEVYSAISGLGLCDDPVYINPENGYKITKFLEGVRTCDSSNVDELTKCMKKLKGFHDMKLTVQHTFDIFGQIDFYENLWEGNPSVYRDYEKTKANVLSLKEFIDSQDHDWCLTHIDANEDNFLFHDTPEGENLQLTDWEYAGMQDPHVDIAMFCIYSMFDKKQTDQLIDIYFEGKCDTKTRAKIYCYMAASGLLWSNWCEYKRLFGIEFGEYSLAQYRYAKDYFKYANELM